MSADIPDLNNSLGKVAFLPIESFQSDIHFCVFVFVSVIISHNGFDGSVPLNYFHFCLKHLLTHWII